MGSPMACTVSFDLEWSKSSNPLFEALYMYLAKEPTY